MKPILTFLCSRLLLAIILFLTNLLSTSYGQDTPQTGTFTDTLKFSNGTSMKFKARVPMKLPKEKNSACFLRFTLMAAMKIPWLIGHQKLFWNVKGLWMIT